MFQEFLEKIVWCSVSHFKLKMTFPFSSSETEKRRAGDRLHSSSISFSVLQEPNSPAGSPPHSPHGNGLDRAPSLRKEMPGSSSTGEAPSTPNPRSPTPGKAKDSAQVRPIRPLQGSLLAFHFSWFLSNICFSLCSQ